MHRRVRGANLTSLSLRLTAVAGVALLTVILVPGWPALGQAGERPGRTGLMGRSRLPEIRRGEVALEIQLEDYIQGYAGGTLEVDRDALTRDIQDLLGTSEALEEVRLAELLDAAPRIRVSWRGLSADLGEKSMLFLARRVVGREIPIRQITVGDMLSALPDVVLSSDGTPTVAGQPDLLPELGRTLRKAERFERARDPEFIERRGLEMEYAQVKVMVKQLRRDGIGQGSDELLYDEAFGRLFDEDRADAVPLLEGHRRLEAELATADLHGTTLAERIAFRWEARRRAFGEDLAETLFGRKEAVERYQVDLLAIESDPSLDAAGRAARIEERRTRLKVELASQGSYVGFVGQDVDRVDTELRARYGDRFDTMSEDELREARRRIYMERLPAEAREDARQIRGRARR